jgi:hypothetical protein
MKEDDLAIMILFTSFIGVLQNMVSNLYHPTSRIESDLLIASYVFIIVIYIITKGYFSNKKRSSNRFASLLRQYNSLWLLVFLISLINIVINLVGEKLQWVVIDSKVTLLLICIIAVVGYRQDSRRKSTEATKYPSCSEEIPRPYEKIKR